MQTQAIAHLEQRAFEIGADVSAVNKLHMIGRLEDNYMLDKPENASQLSFFQYATGITDSQQLKEHIISIAKEAYDVFPYPCIWALYFCKTRVITHPAYAAVLELSKKDESQPIFLDVGSFAGIDLRQVVHTGMKPENVMGTDLIDDWAKIGNKLFNGKGVVPFVKGDIFCNSILDRSTPPNPSSLNKSTPIQLNELKSLNPLKRRVRFITCNSVFHLFDEERQTELALRLASLLDNRSGSTIFGTHVGSDDCYLLKGTGKRGMFMHSPETWRKMWEKIYEPGEARIHVELGPPEPITHLKDFRSMTMLIWSITIL